MKTNRRGMAVTGWAMTLIGSGTVLFWLLYEAVMSFSNAPLATAVSVILVLFLLAMVVPVPLIMATRRAKAKTAARGAARITTTDV